MHPHPLLIMQEVVVNSLNYLIKEVAQLIIGCYVIVFSGTNPNFGNATGWTITIPAGTMLDPCDYYLIGGAGPTSFPSTWTSVSGGIPFSNQYGTNGRAANLNISNSSNSSLFQIVGNLTDNKGQVTLLSPLGAVVSSVSYNSGNNAGTYPNSFSNPPSGCNEIRPIPNPEPPTRQNVNAIFTANAFNRQGIYLDASGIYQAEQTLTPGKSNELNNGPGAQINCSPATPLVAGSHNTTPITVCTGYTPADLNINSPATSGGSTPYSFQWQLSMNGGAWNNIPGAIASIYSPPTLTSAGSYSYGSAITDASEQ
ncbi:MAG: hypothetical protein WKF59_07305 [Chitinophagaceae bacterium]